MPENYNRDDTDPLGMRFFRRVVKRESYANGEGTLSTLQCGHTNSGPAVTDDDIVKPCLRCESEAKQNARCAATAPQAAPSPVAEEDRGS